MEILFILGGSLIILRAIGWLGVKQLASWRDAARYALVIMILFTAAAHFTSMKHDLVAMIPASLPRGLWVIYLTGVLEIAGAIGLVIPRLRRVAAICLVLLLVAMFPANVNAALNEIPLRGRAPTPLWLRLPMQVLFIWMLWWTSIQRSSKERASAH
jgi:uncharacterized membrane protein